MVSIAQIINRSQAILPVSFKYRRTPLIRTLFIPIANYPERPGPSGKHFLTAIVCLFVFLTLQHIVVVFSQPGSGI
jgi:hypothetical protein